MEKGFSKQQRSSFAYWFAHWCGFNMTALVLHNWKFKYLFHDIEKPWLKLFLTYDQVQSIHRNNNRHHTAYKGGVRKLDYEAMVIDWECSRFTKISSPKTAREMFEIEVNGVIKQGKSTEDVEYFKSHLLATYDKLGL